MLTFVRKMELIRTPWDEINLKDAEWVITAERMKMDGLIIPLCPAGRGVFQAAAGGVGVRLVVGIPEQFGSQAADERQHVERMFRPLRVEGPLHAARYALHREYGPEFAGLVA